MPFERIVVNASPLICLFKSGLQDLLPLIFQHIVVPTAVINEVTAHDKKDFPAHPVIAQGWLNSVADIPIDLRIAAWDLGKGESEVISYAITNTDYIAVLDDREARRCAETLRCRRIGTAGVLVLAKLRGLLTSLRDAFAKLSGSGLWLSRELVEELCIMEGE